jgi:ATP-dependent RNA helicase DDX19/DBP5
MYRHLPNECQKMLFSATYDVNVMKFAEQLIPNAIVMRLRKVEEHVHNIKQMYIQCDNRDAKYRAIADISSAVTVGAAMIFCAVRFE